MRPIKPPANLRSEGKAAFRRLVKQMKVQGLEPLSCAYEIEGFARLCDEEAFLLEAAGAGLAWETRMHLSRQISAIIGLKSRLFRTIMRPVAGERRPGKKQIASARAAAANTGKFATPAAPRRLLPGAAPAAERSVLERYLGAPESSKPNWDELLGDDEGEGDGEQ
jgi:hypothetical protein